MARRIRRLRPRTRFRLGEYEDLEQMLMAKPSRVLEQFAVVGIGCLSELDAYHRVRHLNPERAKVIEFVAATMGIPINADDLLDDVLSGPHGEV